MGAPTQNIFEDLYRESVHEGGPIVPWDSQDAKPRIKELALLGAIRGDVLTSVVGSATMPFILLSKALMSPA